MFDLKGPQDSNFSLAGEHSLSLFAPSSPMEQEEGGRKPQPMEQREALLCEAGSSNWFSWAKVSYQAAAAGAAAIPEKKAR